MAVSPKQAELVKKLLGERVVPDEIRVMAEAKLSDKGLTPGQFSKTGIIDVLFSLPVAGAKQVAALAPGTYWHDDTVYSVALSKSSGRRYAKVLDVASGKLVYVSGAIYKLPADAQPVTVAEAMAFGLRFGRCIHCGHALETKDSVLLSIGPVCAVNHHGMTQKQLILAQREMVPALAL